MAITTKIKHLTMNENVQLLLIKNLARLVLNIGVHTSDAW